MKHYTITYKYDGWISHSFWVGTSPEEAMSNFHNKESVISVEETTPEKMQEMIEYVESKDESTKEWLIYEWRLNNFITSWIR